MATYEVKQGKDIKHIDPTVEHEKWYVIDEDSDRIVAGPYNTRAEAEAKRRALMAPKPK